jgi:hypothetical protein
MEGRGRRRGRRVRVRVQLALARQISGESESGVNEGRSVEAKQEGGGRMRGRMRRRMRVRVRVSWPCRLHGADVRLHDSLELLNVAQLSISLRSLDGFIPLLMLFLSASVELLLTDERHSCVASLQSDGERRVSVAEKILGRERGGMSGQIAKDSSGVCTHAAVRLDDEWKQLIIVCRCDGCILSPLLLLPHLGADE